MPTTVLLSIKPVFAEKILNGTKTFEYRRRLFADPAVSRVMIYATAPVRCVVGEFCVGRVLSMPKRPLWQVTRHGGGIPWPVFSDYFAEKAMCHAIEVVHPTRYERAVPLAHLCRMSRPPQSFAYIEDAER